jgi:hypothetical protein
MADKEGLIAVEILIFVSIIHSGIINAQLQLFLTQASM